MCTILLNNISDTLPENELTYLNYLRAALDSTDELSTVEVYKNPYTYSFRIACSNPRYSQIVLSQLLDFHNLFNIKLDISKSIRNTSTINFEIPMT